MTTRDDPHDSSEASYRFVSTADDPFGEQQLIDQGMDPNAARRFADDVEHRHDGLPELGQKFEIEYMARFERLENADAGPDEFSSEHPVVVAARQAAHPILEPSAGFNGNTNLDWVCVGNGWHTSMDGVAIRAQLDDAFVVVVVGGSFGVNPDLTESESIRLDAHGMVNGPLGLELPDTGDDDSDDLDDPRIAVQYQRDLEASERKVLDAVLEHGVELIDLPVDGDQVPFRVLTYRDSWFARGEFERAPVLLYGRQVLPADVTLTTVDPAPYIERYLAARAEEAEAASEDDEDDWSEDDCSGHTHRPRRIRPQDVEELIKFKPIRVARPEATSSLSGWSGDADELATVRLAHRLVSSVGQVIISTGTTIDPRTQLIHQQGLLFELPEEQESRLIQRLLLAPQEIVSIPVDDEAVDFAVVEWEDTFSAWAWTGQLGIELWGRGLDLRALRLESVSDLSSLVQPRRGT